MQDGHPAAVQDGGEAYHHPGVRAEVLRPARGLLRARAPPEVYHRAGQVQHAGATPGVSRLAPAGVPTGPT